MTAEPTYRLEGVVKAKAQDNQDFEGPLDLILLLLSKNKIEIQDIKISVILEQYLGYLEEMKRMDLEIASEFVSMASYLVYLKSKTLLVSDEEGDSEMEEFIKALEQRQRQEDYVRIKAVIESLSPRYDSGKNLITHDPEPLPPDMSYRYQHSPEDLTAALMGIILRAEHKLPPPVSLFEGIVGYEPYPVSEKTEEIIKLLLINGVMRLKELFESCKSRSEIVATFISVLELCRSSNIVLAGFDDECTVAYAGGDRQ